MQQLMPGYMAWRTNISAVLPSGHISIFPPKKILPLRKNSRPRHHFPACPNYTFISFPPYKPFPPVFSHHSIFSHIFSFSDNRYIPKKNIYKKIKREHAESCSEPIYKMNPAGQLLAVTNSLESSPPNVAALMRYNLFTCPRVCVCVCVLYVPLEICSTADIFSHAESSEFEFV